MVKTIDWGGNATTFDYSDRFGAPDGDAQSNAGAAELGGLFSYGFPSKVTNALGHETYIQYDYHLGKPVDGEDANGTKTSVYYNDTLDRPTQVVRAVGIAGVQSQTTFFYERNKVTAYGDRDNYDDNVIISATVYDGLGRPVETHRAETSSVYNIVKQTYDGLGRRYQVSNQYRPGESIEWTTTLYDVLGRVTRVTTPDGAHIDTVYSGNRVTVTDQSGKRRSSETDALGRLKRVIEDPGGLGYETIYLHDTLDNLRQVTQGTQIRYFAYDALSRLIRARNPEQNANGNLTAYTDPVTGNSQWSTAYSYDNNGNLKEQTDARGVVTTISYDALNRPISKTFGTQNTTAVATPAVNYYYDGQPLHSGVPSINRDYSIGRLVGVTYGGSEGNYFSYDPLGKAVEKWQRTGTTNYRVQATYNLAGAITAQTYPSNHTLNYTFDQAGRLSGFNGNLGGGSVVNYATGIQYNGYGLVGRETYGTQTPLYLKLHYNRRMQLADLRLSSVDNEWDFNRGCMTFFYGSNGVTSGDPFANNTDNNGNLWHAFHYVPSDDAVSAFSVPMRHDYSYDSLNRIVSVHERQQNQSGVWTESVSQVFSYDRWGNRTIGLPGGGSGGNSEVVWVEDALPAGATASGDEDGWNWTTSNPSPYSGVSSHQSAVAARIHQHKFSGATQTLQVNAGDVLYCYIYLDAANPPSEVMLQWNDGTWEHRAFWGANNIPWGADGTTSRRYMGPLPPAGQWVRLEVPANAVGLEGKAINGMAFTLYGGRANWDQAGKVSYGTVGVNNKAYTVEATNTNRLQPPSGNGTMGYDAAGNLTLDSYTNPALREFKYDAENRLIEVYNGDGLLVSKYVYDAEGRRVRRISGGRETWQVYGMGGELLAEYAANAPTVVKKEYGYRNGKLLVVWDSSETGNKQLQWLVQDHLGSTRMVVDRSGSLDGIKRHDNLPYGEELATGIGIRSSSNGYGGDLVRQKFTSYERDVETELDFAQARYYSSVQSRFVSPDSVPGSTLNPQSLNRYAYVLGNPLKFNDPTGNKTLDPAYCILCDDYYVNGDGTINIQETDDDRDWFYTESSTSPGVYNLEAVLVRNAAGLVQFPASGLGFERYGTVDAGGNDRNTGELVGAGDHFLEPIVAAALFGLIRSLNDDQGFTMSFGDMSSSNGSDPWQRGGGHHAGHGHQGTRSGLDVDFRYLNQNGRAFQSPTATTDGQFSTDNNQRVYDTARTFGFTRNYQGTGSNLTGVTRVGGHNDHGHLGFVRANARMVRGFAPATAVRGWVR